MKNKILIISCFIIIKCTSSYSQNYTYYGDKAFGTNRPEHYPSVIYSDNGSFVLAGESLGNINGDKTDPLCDSIHYNSDIWVLKIDTGFNIVWNKSYGGNYDEYLPHLIVVNNANNLIMTCESISDSSCNKTANNNDTTHVYADYWLSKIDNNGNQLDDHSWGGISDDQSPQTIQLSSGNFIICGTSKSAISGEKSIPNYSADTTDYWVIKTDSSGNKLWDKVYGGTGNEYSNFSDYQYQFMILQDKKDNFIIAGTTDSPISGNISDSSRGARDIWIVKLDSSGNKIWDHRYGGVNNESCNHIIHTNDNGYILCGSTSSLQGGDVTDSSKGGGDCWLIKLDSIGNKQWDKRFGGNKNDLATWIEKAPGGGYWVSGMTYSDSSSDVSQPRYGAQSDYWIFKIDDAGNKLWDHRYGGPGINVGSTFIIMPDSSIFLVGESGPGINAVKSDAGRGMTDYWVVHFKYTDPVSPVGINEIANFNNSISVFPNPTKDIITIKSPNEKIKQIELFNIVGESIYIQNINNLNSTQINLQNYSQGFYFVKISSDKYSVTKKVLKE